MDKKQFEAQMNEIIGKARAAVDAGDTEKAREFNEQAKALQDKFDALAKERANTEALAAGLRKASDPVIKPMTQTTELRVTNPQPRMDVSSDIYKTAVAKSLIGAKLDEDEANAIDVVNAPFRAAANPTTAAEHQVIIPTTMQQSIWTEMAEQHPIIGDVNFTDVRGMVEIPKENAGIGDAEWVNEATEATDGVPTFTNITLAGHELVKSVRVSWKMRNMAIDAFMSYVTSQIAEKMGNAIANAIVNGKGVPSDSSFVAQPYGIITRLNAEASTPQLVTYTPTAGVTYKNITQAMAVIKSGYGQGTRIYAKAADIWNLLANITSDKKEPMFVPDPVNTRIVGRLFGREVVEEDAIPAGSFLFGNVSAGYVMNRNQPVSIYNEDHVKARATDYMGYAIIDGDVLTTKAFALLSPSK